MTDADMLLANEFEPPSHEVWMSLVEKVLKGGDFSKRLISHTVDGLPIQPLFTRRHVVQESPAAFQTVWFPGGWDIRQRHLENDPEKANEAILDDLAGGATSILLQITAPGQQGLGYGPEALGAALKDVFLNGCCVALDARESTLDAAGSLMEIWREAGISENVRRGAFNYDPLGTLAKIGTLNYEAERSCQIGAGLAADVRTMSHVTALLADGRPYHEAGASEAQELAAMLSTLVAYLRACEGLGLRSSIALRQIALALACDADLFLSVAKLRAARRLVLRIGEACGAGTTADTMHLTAATSERMMTRRDPWVNVLRTTIACAGAALGGADAVTVLPFTWALGQPDAFARRIARNTQLILQEESSVARTKDPAHGSWYVEKLSYDLEKNAWLLFQDLESKGGMPGVLQSGYLRDEIDKIADARNRDLNSGRQALTGVSAFPLLTENSIKVKPHVVVPPTVTGGVSIERLAARRLAEPFERLRDQADAHYARTGNRPWVPVLLLGEPAAQTARTAWIHNALAAGGIKAVESEALRSSAAVGRAFTQSGGEIACLCGSDQIYRELGEAAVGALKKAGAKHVVLVGRPKDQETTLASAGVDIFVFDGCDVVAVLTKLQGILGVGPSKES